MGLLPDRPGVTVVLITEMLLILGLLLYVEAYICKVGREKDEVNVWRWVLPYDNPCGCKKIIMGGVNTWTPIRPFKPIYVDSPLLSADIHDIRKHYGLHCVGTWDNWSQWDSCSTSCGTGSTSRVRQCVKPATYAPCEGKQPKESQDCNNGQCPIWSEWGAWETCSTTCGNGTQVRVRECMNQDFLDHSYNSSLTCDGDQPKESQHCNDGQCPFLGEWNAWGSCSTTCGNGYQERVQECVNSDFPDVSCNEEPLYWESKNCDHGPCPVWSEWGEWDGWNICSATCGNETVTRVRDCVNSDFIDASCNGEQPMEYKACNNDSQQRWGKNGDYCYYVRVNAFYTYNQSCDACLDQNAMLTSVVTREEQHFLIEFVRDFNELLWIGLNDKTVEGSWEWEDGTPSLDEIGFKYWAAHQPSIDPTESVNEDCVHFRGRHKARKWDDKPCNVTNISGYICKRRHQDPEWKLVFKAVSEIVSSDQRWGTAGYQNDPLDFLRDPYLIWERNAPYNENIREASHLNTAFKGHYKSPSAVNWESRNITEVKFALLNYTGEELVKLVFNGEGSTALDWFAKDRLLSSPWDDVFTEDQNFFFAYGDSAYDVYHVYGANRRWLINRGYHTCSWSDEGWISVFTGFFSTICFWEEPPRAKPNFLYSLKNTYVNFDNYADVGEASIMAIFVKTNDSMTP